MNSGNPVGGTMLSHRNSVMLFLRMYGLLQQRQETTPDKERQGMIERLRPLRNKLVHNVGLDESEWALVGSSLAELVDYLRLMESSSLGTAQAQTNRLLSTAVDIDDVLQRSPVDPPAPQNPASKADSAQGVEAWAELAVQGDPQAIGRVLASIRPLVVRYCRARMRSSQHAADDVAQETCLAVLTALPAYRAQGRGFLAFVYGIAAHKVADAHRAAATRARGDSMLEVDDIETDMGPEQRAMQGELTRRMKQLLDILPDKQREIVVLRVVVGLTAEETAEAVGSTPGAVRVAQHRALARLRKAMEEA
jgi:RNA polymerase sigma-70 factor (ECF subfamily)